MNKLRWYFAPCTPSLEPLLAAEVEAAGGSRIRSDRGGVSFQGDRRVGYHLALWSRVALRVLEELARKRIGGPDDLYDLAGEVTWQKLLREGQTFAVFGAVSGDRVRHSKYAALKVKDAIVDQLRDRRGTRPDVNREDPDLLLKVTVRDQVATLARDLSGRSLHRRGWRPESGEAPLNEAVAAGLIQLTGWDRRSPLCDPMCGSGTLLIEAAHLAADRAPGLDKPYAHERWPDHDATAWAALKAEAAERFTPDAIPPLRGNDRDAGVLAIARANAERAGVAHAIEWTRGPVTDFVPDPAPAIVVVNPPYGIRIGGDGLARTWSELGSFLKRCKGATAWVLCGEKELTGHLKMKTSRRIPILNGGIDCRWLRYSVA